MLQKTKAGLRARPCYLNICARNSVRGDCLFCRWLFHRGHAALHRFLHLFERAHFDLSYALARDTELSRKLLERDRIVGQTSRFEDAPLALVENVQSGDQRLVPIVALFALGKNAFLAWCVIDEPILPLAALAIIADGRIEGSIAAETAVHVDHILFGHAEALGNHLHLIEAQVAFLKRGNLAL